MLECVRRNQGHHGKEHSHPRHPVPEPEIYEKTNCYHLHIKNVKRVHLGTGWRGRERPTPRCPKNQHEQHSALWQITHLSKLICKGWKYKRGQGHQYTRKIVWCSLLHDVAADPVQWWLKPLWFGVQCTHPCLSDEDPFSYLSAEAVLIAVCHLSAKPPYSTIVCLLHMSPHEAWLCIPMW